MTTNGNININNSISYFPFIRFHFLRFWGDEPSFTVLYLFSVHLPPPSTHTPAARLRVSLPGLLWIFWGSSSEVLH